MTRDCLCECHDAPNIMMHDSPCCEHSTQWACIEDDCDTPFDSVELYHLFESGRAVSVYCKTHGPKHGTKADMTKYEEAEEIMETLSRAGKDSDD